MDTSPSKYQKHKNEVKITVKHFLNTELKPDIDKNSGLLLYPLYIRVSVNRQLTKFKSRLNHYLPIDDLDQFLLSEPFKSYADNERLIIEQTISDEKPEQKNIFKLTNWSDTYKSGLDSLMGTVSKVIMYDIDMITRFNHGWSDVDLKQLNSLTIPEILAYLSSKGISETRSIQEKYGVLLKTGSYENIIQAVDGVAFDFCIWDAKNGFFQDRLLKSKIDIDSSYIETLDKFISLVEV